MTARGGPPVVATMAIEVPAVEALVLPEPGGPRVIGVIETRFANALQQEVMLATEAATPGQNAFDVTFFGPVEGRTGPENLKSDTFLTDEAISEEMEQALPGLGMSPSTYFVQNRYGPFGYALGRGQGRDLCMYAWQRIQGQDRVNVLTGDRGVLSVRLRFCQSGASEASLLRIMYRYTINGYFLPRSWQPYGRPLPASPELGRIGGPIIYPAETFGTSGASAPPPAPARTLESAPRSVSPPSEGAPTVPSAPLEGYPTVPAPL
ncbi:cellulose biosynthesis protein BcsN [Ancylobacter sp. FA202]|uniref:cellulose biosynthesis protein BcsN n=1 Tax=Ancylobacter sp. FA202 TaxID=1111106 RepID=UPI00036875A6|nr:cellulose biosynthesis protein BcsN [Ancylobacter sp. FA202]